MSASTMGALCGVGVVCASRMDWYWSPAGLVMAAVAPLMGALAWRAWRHRPASAAGSLALVLGAASWWSVAYALELSGASLATMRFWGDLKYLGILLLAPAWLVFALQYTQRPVRLTPRRVALLGVMPALTVALLANDATRDLVRSYQEVRPGELPYVAVGPLFWFHFAYTYSLLLAGAFVLISACLRASRPYRRQGLVLIAGIGGTLLGNALHIGGVGPLRLFDPTPFAVLLMGMVLMWGLLRSGLLELVPLARSAVVERMSDAVLVLDAYGRVVDLNPAASELFGVTAGRAIGQGARSLLPDVDHWLDRHGGTFASHEEVRLAGQDYDLAVSTLSDDAGRLSGYALVLRDVTARKRDADRMSRLALYDSLTGLANRKLFTDRLEDTLRAARPGHRPFALLFCDLDRFKRINDTLGHEAGDLVLQRVATRLARAVRPGDLVARLGGDEFVVLLPDAGDLDEVLRVAAELLSAVAQPLPAGRHELYLTVSIGVSRYPDGGQDAATLLRQADTAMYRAKAAGRDRVEYERRGDDRALERLQLERDLHGRGAQELELWYQPITSLWDWRCVGVEALLRWRHPLRGLLEPDLFVPLAEQSGLVGDLGAWVLREACRQAVAWQREHTADFSVAVNVAARQFEPGLPRQVASVLEETGFAPSNLTLEITESAVLADGRGALRVLHELKDLGVRIATDDFGTGYTSLEQLRSYPLDVLKIDRSFVSGLQHGQPDEVIVAALVTLAHDLGLSVVAEGVETLEQCERLASYSCDAAQGFLFSPPLAPAAASAYLASAL